MESLPNVGSSFIFLQSPPDVRRRRLVDPRPREALFIFFDTLWDLKVTTGLFMQIGNVFVSEAVRSPIMTNFH